MQNTRSRTRRWDIRQVLFENFAIADIMFYNIVHSSNEGALTSYLKFTEIQWERDRYVCKNN